MRNILAVEADIKGHRRVPAYTVTQNDSIRIVVTVLDGGDPVQLDGITTITLASTRRDGYVVVKAGEQTGPNEVTVDLGTTEIELTGKVDAVLQLYAGEDRVSTIKFAFTVVKDPTGEGFVPSEKEQTIIEVVLGDGPLIVERAEVAAEYIEDKRPLIDKFTDGQTNLQTQLDEVARGATNVETSQARVDAKGGTHATLKARLDAEQTAVASQLADTAINPHHLKYRGEVNTFSENSPGNGCVVFTDDGGRRELLEFVKPVLDQYGIKISIATELNVVGNNGHLMMEEFKMLYREGHEIMSHSLTHADFATLTKKGIIHELVESKRIWKENGMEPINFVYPYNSAPTLARSLVLDYYRSAAGIGATASKPPFRQEMLSRVAVGSYQTHTMAELKAMCLKAKQDGEMLTLMTHFGFIGGGVTTPQQSYQGAIELIEYCVANNIDILTMDQALDRLGNISQIGTISNGGYRIVGSDKKVYTDLAMDNVTWISEAELSFYRTPSFFNKFLSGNSPKILYATIGEAALPNINLPVRAPGVFIVEKVTSSGRLDKREYRVSSSDITYISYGLSDKDDWSGWQQKDGTITLPGSELPNNEPPSYFNRFISDGTMKEIYYRFGTGNSNPNLPRNVAGDLKVTKISNSNILDKQEFREASKGVVHVRYGKSNDTYTSWASPSGFTSQRPTEVWIGYQYFDTTLGKPVWWNGTNWKDANGTTV